MGLFDYTPLGLLNKPLTGNDTLGQTFNQLGGGPNEAYINKGIGALQSTQPDWRNYYIDSSGYQGQVHGLYNQAGGLRYDSDLANAARGQQQQATNLLANTAQGRGPSLANATLNRSLGNINNQLRAAAFAQQGNRGAGLTQRNLLNAQVAASNNAQANAGVASAQEQLGAQNALVGATAQQRAGDLYAARQQYDAGLAGINTQANLAGAQYGAVRDQSQALQNYDAARQQYGANQANIYTGAAAGVGAGQAAGFKTLLDTGGGIAKLASDMTAKQDIEPIKQLQPLPASNFNAKVEYPQAAPANSGGGGGLGDLLSTVGPLVAASVASDRGVKEDVGQAPVGEFLNNIKPYRYEYKDPERHGEGRRMGIMAQDAQKSALGNDMVNEQPGQPLSIDIPKAVSASLASVAYLNERLKKLEASRNG